MSEPTTISIRRDGAVARLTLDRPEVRNAMNPVMITEIREAFERFSTDRELRVVVIEGAGSAFCAGGDLKWMRDVLGMTEAEVAQDSRNLFEMFSAINECPGTVITKVQGAAFAGASGILAASDIVIARHDAQFRISEVRLGLVPGIIAAFIIPRSGANWLRYLAMSGILFDGQTARLAGLVHELADDDEDLERRVRSHVSLALQSSPDALAETGQLISEIASASREDRETIALAFNARSRKSRAAQEGISAFLEKRRPEWWQDAGPQDD